MIQPKNETESLLLSITRNCEMLFKQTQKKAEEALEVRLTQPKQTFSFQRAINLGPDSNWLFGLTSPEVYNTICNITEKKQNGTLNI